MKNVKSGFSLLEIMVSIALLSTIIILLGRTVIGTVETTQRISDQNRMDETARLILDRIAADLESALIHTNTPFFVEEKDGFQSLYFISYGSRKWVGNMQRDAVPIRYQHTASGALRVDFPYRITGNSSPANISRLILASDYNHPSSPFMAATTGYSIETDSVYLSQPPSIEQDQNNLWIRLEDGVRNTPCLTRLRFSINGIHALGRTPDPRFIDVEIGLLPETKLLHIRRLQNAGNTLHAANYQAMHEQSYFRRIPLNNREQNL